jgi:hypothetical protein
LEEGPADLILAAPWQDRDLLAPRTPRASPDSEKGHSESYLPSSVDQPSRLDALGMIRILSYRFYLACKFRVLESCLQITFS